MYGYMCHSVHVNQKTTVERVPFPLLLPVLDSRNQLRSLGLPWQVLYQLNCLVGLTLNF